MLKFTIPSIASKPLRHLNNNKTTDNVEDLSVPMAHYKRSSQISNQNLFGRDNSHANLQPAIKPQVNTSNREWSSSVTISNNTKTNGKQQNNRHWPHCKNNHFWQLVSNTKTNHKIDIKTLSKTNCARIVRATITPDKIVLHKRADSPATADIILFYTTLQNNKRPPAAFSTGSAPFSPSHHSSNGVSPSQNKQHCHYGQSFVKTITRSNLDSPSNNQSFCVNRKPSPPKDWLEQLQLIPVSFVNGKKTFDTYALIDHGSQFTFLLDTITKMSSTSLRSANINYTPIREYPERKATLKDNSATHYHSI